MAGRPNILWYCTDQQRFDTIGALGNPHVHTPNLDRFLSTGVAFTRAYCQAPICTPSRASFLTGMYPSRVHVNSNNNAFFPPEAAEFLVPHRLAESGYDCGLVGKLHLAHPIGRREPRVNDGYRWFRHSQHPRDDWPPGQHDYADWLRDAGHDPAHVLRHKERPNRLIRPTPDDDNVPPELHQTTWCTNEAIEFIQQARDPDTPWLLSVNPYDPHPPYDPPWEYWRRFQPENLPGPHFRTSDLAHQAGLAAADFQSEARDPAEFDGQGIQAAYYAMIELVDEQFGRLLDALEASGQRDDTLVIFTSDHGEAAGDHGLIQKGCRFFDGLTRVPLIWSWPARFEPNRQSDALVELTDIAPTLLEAAGETIPDAIQGRSLLPLLSGAAPLDRHRDFVRCEYFDALSFTPGTMATMYRDDRWKLVQYHSLGLGELYDLDADPYEFRSLWEDPEHAGVRADLIERTFNATVMAADPGPPTLRRR